MFHKISEKSQILKYSGYRGCQNMLKKYRRNPRFSDLGGTGWSSAVSGVIESHPLLRQRGRERDRAMGAEVSTASVPAETASAKELHGRSEVVDLKQSCVVATPTKIKTPSASGRAEAPGKRRACACTRLK